MNDLFQSFFGTGQSAELAIFLDDGVEYKALHNGDDLQFRDDVRQPSLCVYGESDAVNGKVKLVWCRQCILDSLLSYRSLFKPVGIGACALRKKKIPSLFSKSQESLSSIKLQYWRQVVRLLALRKLSIAVSGHDETSEVVFIYLEAVDAEFAFVSTIGLSLQLIVEARSIHERRLFDRSFSALLAL